VNSRKRPGTRQEMALQVVMRGLAGIGSSSCWSQCRPSPGHRTRSSPKTPRRRGEARFLVESNVNYLKDNEYRSTAVPLAFTAGINETMDTAVEIPYLLLRPSAVTGQPESGFGDVLFKFKHRFYEQERRDGEDEQPEHALAYQVAFSQPTGREEQGLGVGKTRWGARLLGTTEWESVEIIANLGYRVSGRALRRGNFSFDYVVAFSIAVEYERPKPWEPVVELA